MRFFLILIAADVSLERGFPLGIGNLRGFVAVDLKRREKIVEWQLRMGRNVYDTNALFKRWLQ